MTQVTLAEEGLDTLFGTQDENLRRIEDTRERVYDPAVTDPYGDALERARQDQLPAGVCPVCSQTMIKEEYGFGSEILVERCPSRHGVWLDIGELQAIEKYYERSRKDANQGWLAFLWELMNATPK